MNVIKLRGTLPSELSALESLQILDVGSNLLEGPMPPHKNYRTIALSIGVLPALASVLYDGGDEKFGSGLSGCISLA